MTGDEILVVLGVVRRAWPHSNIDGGDPEGNARLWHAALKAYDRLEVTAVIERMAVAGREHAPLVGVVAHAAELERQGLPPAFDEVGTAVMRAQRWLPYDPWGRYSPADTALAIAVLAARGVHEAILRFVGEQGLRGAFTMPWNERGQLGRNESADHRDMARHYRDVTVPGWRERPQSGLALERACRTAQLDPGEVLQLAGVRKAQLTAPARRALPAPEAVLDGDDEELGDPAAVQEAIQRTIDAIRMGKRRKAEAAAAARDAELAHRRAAELQLAEHARLRDGSSC